MPKYFFNVVMNGQPTVDCHGREVKDHKDAQTHAHYTAMLLADHVRDYDRSFVAVSGEDGRLAFKVPFPRPPAREKIGSDGAETHVSNSEQIMKTVVDLPQSEEEHFSKGGMNTHCQKAAANLRRGHL